MMATAADSLGDVGATSATIVSLLVFRFFHINIDGVIGLVVSVLVLLAGVNIAKDTLAPLLGQAIEPEVYHRISEFVESYDGIIGSHDLIRCTIMARAAVWHRFMRKCRPKWILKILMQ